MMKGFGNGEYFMSLMIQFFFIFLVKDLRCGSISELKIINPKIKKPSGAEGL